MKTPHTQYLSAGYSSDYLSELSYDDKDIGSLLYGKYCGYVTFAYEYEDKKSAEEAYGPDFNLRVPDHSEFEHPRGCVHRDFAELARNGVSWLDLSVLTALKYAQQTVVIVAPVELVLSPLVLQHPVAKGKSFLFVPLEKIYQDRTSGKN